MMSPPLHGPGLSLAEPQECQWLYDSDPAEWYGGGVGAQNHSRAKVLLVCMRIARACAVSLCYFLGTFRTCYFGRHAMGPRHLHLQ